MYRAERKWWSQPCYMVDHYVLFIVSCYEGYKYSKIKATHFLQRNKYQLPISSDWKRTDVSMIYYNNDDKKDSNHNAKDLDCYGDIDDDKRINTIQMTMIIKQPKWQLNTSYYDRSYNRYYISVTMFINFITSPLSLLRVEAKNSIDKNNLISSLSPLLDRIRHYNEW